MEARSVLEIKRLNTIRRFIGGESLWSIAEAERQIISTTEETIRGELRGIVNFLDAHGGIDAPLALNGKELSPLGRVMELLRHKKGT